MGEPRCCVAQREIDERVGIDGTRGNGAEKLGLRENAVRNSDLGHFAQEGASGGVRIRADDERASVGAVVADAMVVGECVRSDIGPVEEGGERAGRFVNYDSDVVPHIERNGVNGPVRADGGDFGCAFAIDVVEAAKRLEFPIVVVDTENQSLSRRYIGRVVAQVHDGEHGVSATGRTVDGGLRDLEERLDGEGLQALDALGQIRRRDDNRARVVLVARP